MQLARKLTAKQPPACNLVLEVHAARCPRLVQAQHLAQVGGQRFEDPGVALARPAGFSLLCI